MRPPPQLVYVPRRRLPTAEEELCALWKLYEALTPAELRALAVRWFDSLIRAGLLVSPDPDHPHVSIAVLRESHPEAIQEMVTTLFSEQWQYQHERQAKRLMRTLMKAIIHEAEG